MKKPLWQPDKTRVEGSQLWAFREKLRTAHSLPGDDYPSLHRWSVENLQAFWAAAWEDLWAEPETGTEAKTNSASARKYSAVLADTAMPPHREAPNEAWFPGARFNFAERMLRHRDDRVALMAEGEDGHKREVTYAQLYALVRRAMGGLIKLGVAPGDRVAGFMPNSVETVVAMLAATGLGAMWSSTSPDFGFQGVLDRFGQIDPKVLICGDGYRYNGKSHSSLEKATRLMASIPSLEQLVVAPFLGEAGHEIDGSNPAALPSGTLAWDDFLQGDLPESFEFPRFPFDHPVYILYSSGTTGVPKCIVHGAGGTLLKHHVEHKLNTDIRREDVLFYYTTCGWMMWNWLVSGLTQGCTLVLYDGSPAYPEGDRLFRLAEESGITVLGTSPKYLGACQKAGLRPRDKYTLAPLRTLLSTGSPLEPGQFAYVHDAVKPDLQLASIAGGTDLIGCFMQGNPLSAVHAGEIQGLALGMDVAALDDNGQPVVGAQGELVCRQPFPSMPVYFWKDPAQALYKKAYFDHYPGIWRHGDFVTITPGGGVVVHGRSDATLNPGGVRIGTAEIYRIVEALPSVLDSVVVGHQSQGDVRVVLFVVLQGGTTLDAQLEADIRAAVRSRATPRHVPAVIRQISEVPVTISGKKVELAVSALLKGQPVKNKDALANPDALKQFEGLSLD